MSLDDHIHQLSETIIGELRAPIEASLRRLLAEVLAAAGRERDEAIATAGRERDDAVAKAVAAANARQEAAIETALDAASAEAEQRSQQALETASAEAERRVQQALETASAEAEQRMQQALETASSEAEQRVQQALETASAEAEQRMQQALDGAVAAFQAEAQDALDSLRSSAEADRQIALAALQSELGRAHEAELAAIRESTAAEVSAAIEQARAEVEQQRDAGAAAWESERDELLRRHADEVTSLHEQHRAELETVRAALTGEHEAQVAAFVEQAAAERDAAIRAALEDAAHERDAAHVRPGGAARKKCGRPPFERRRRWSGRPTWPARSGCWTVSGSSTRAGSLSEVLATLADHVGLEATRSACCSSRARGSAAGALPGSATSCPPISTCRWTRRAARPRGGDWRRRSPRRTRAGRTPCPRRSWRRAAASVSRSRSWSAAAWWPCSTRTMRERVRPVVPSNWPEVTEVLDRHAGRCLEVLTLSRVSGPWPSAAVGSRPPRAGRRGRGAAAARPGRPGLGFGAAGGIGARHARLLLSEIKLYNEEAVEEGRHEGNLLALLGSEIDRARRLYEEKIPAIVRERVDCFDEEIVRTLAGGNATLLGQVT